MKKNKDNSIMYKNKKKGKPKQVKPVPKKENYSQNLNYNVQKDIKPDKIKPSEIFEGCNDSKTKKICPKGHKVCKCQTNRKKKK